MFFSDEINKKNKIDVEEISSFLKGYDVKYDYPEKTFVIRDKGSIISTGSLDGNVLKYFFTDCNYKGEGTISIIYNSLLNYLIEKGNTSYFVFTTPANKEIFSSLGLDLIYETKEVTLLEGGFSSYPSWIKSVKDQSFIDKNSKDKDEYINKKSIRGSIVMNCNPMTLGHLYLIEKAIEEADELIIFVVEEDKSVFPFKDRLKIMKEELKNYKNIKLVPSGPYIISSATFPTYFLKEEDDKLDIYTKLDASIFGEKIAKDLGINIRFLGTEPTDTVTRTYNKNIQRVLEDFNIQVKVIGRKELQGDIISASKVRNLLKQGKKEEAYTYLPDSTIDFLETEKGREIIDNIKI